MAGDTVRRLTEDFYTVHDRVYGHSTRGPIRIVNLRAVHQADAGHDAIDAFEAQPGEAVKGARRIVTAESGGFVDARVYDRSRLTPGTRFSGPAIVEQTDTTTVVEPGWSGEIDARGSLVLTAEGEAR